MIKYKNVVTNTPEISVHVTYTEKLSNTILRGYAIKTANASLAGAAKIYTKMRAENPNLPDIVLATPQNYKRILPEQTKALPEVVRGRFFVALENLVDLEPQKAFATVIMVDGGLRTSEAAGVLPQQLLLEEDDRITVPVLYQEKQGNRTAVLKTESAYRLVPLSYWGSELIRRSCKQIGDVPDDQPLVPAKELSAWILRLLRKCGCDDTFMQSVRDAQSQEPETDKDGRAIYDIAAYVLRRDRTDRWRNCCGLTCNPDGESELDYLLGHQAPHKRRKTNMRLPEQGDTTVRRINTGGLRIGQPIIGQNDFNCGITDMEGDKTGE